MAPRWLRAVVLGALFLLAPAYAHAEGPFDAWLGSYDNTRSLAETRRVIDQAIERVTGDMKGLRRRIARSRLERVSLPSAQLHIRVEDDQLVTDFDGRRYRAPINGNPERGVDPRGKRVTVSYHVVGNVLQARYVGDDGEKRVDFETAEDGHGLTMHVTLLGEELPEPVRYRVQYRRE